MNPGAAPANTELPKVPGALPWKTADFSPVQLWNVYQPMEVTLAGMVTLVSPVQPWNVYQPMEVTLAGMVTLVSPVQ